MGLGQKAMSYVMPVAMHLRPTTLGNLRFLRFIIKWPIIFTINYRFLRLLDLLSIPLVPCIEWPPSSQCQVFLLQPKDLFLLSFFNDLVQFENFLLELFVKSDSLL